MDKFNKTAIAIMEQRYLLEGETPNDMFNRVATFIGNDDNERRDFFSMMWNLDFLPGSPVLMNAGVPNGQLASCFVLPIEDNMESIFDTLKNSALIHKSGGGVGIDFTPLRASNSIVNSTKGVASGPVSFMKIYNEAIEQVKQGGRRRGANMGILDINHPDIIKFINAKRDSKKLSNFNLSIAVTDEYMHKFIKGYHGEFKPRFNSIVNSAWHNGEPGLIFVDEINRNNQGNWMTATNPCGEQPLEPYEACVLGSINLSNFVRDDGYLNYYSLRKTVEKVMIFLNNTLDKSIYPLSEIDKKVKKNRKIGLGVMGFADMLIRRGVKYNSDEALEIASFIMRDINNIAHQYVHYKKSMSGVLRLKNATITTIAPTGTLSIIAGCSSGIEPNFSYKMERNILDNETFIEYHPLYKEYSETNPDVLVTAHDVSPEYHVRMQAAFQEYTDNAVSKTVNLPNSATKQDVADIFILAWKLKCKGITVYRDQSRESQVLESLVCECSL